MYSPLKLAMAIDRPLVRWSGVSIVTWWYTRKARHPYIPTLLLRTIDVTNRPRDAVMYYFRHEDAYVVVGSIGGRPRDPRWVDNLRRDPNAVIWVGRRRLDVVASESGAAERKRLWEWLVTQWPQFQEFQVRAAPRCIPVFLLKR